MKFADKWRESVVTGGWVSPPHEKVSGVNYITDAQYAVAEECGIDCMFNMYENPSAYGDEKILQALHCAANHNVGCVVIDYRLNDCDDEERKRIINMYRGCEAFTGVNIFDEPGIARFKQLRGYQDAIKAISPDCLCYINLLPVYAYSTILKGTYKEGDTQVATKEEYREYLDAFVRDCKCDVLSYDFYPFRFGYGIYDKDYFWQMNEVRERAQRANIPFWTFIQLTSWGEHIPLLTPEEIRWQVHTSLAGNAGGIMYFTYWTPVDSAAEQYRGALISANGEKGESFDTVKCINAFIRRVGKKLFAASYKGMLVPPSLSKQIPPQDTKLPEWIANNSDDGILIGVFELNRKLILYAVNTSFDGERNFAVKLSNVGRINIYSETEDEIKASASEYSRPLNKGCAVMLEIG